MISKRVQAANEALCTAVRVQANAIADNGVRYRGTLAELTSDVADKLSAEITAWGKVCDPSGDHDVIWWNLIEYEVRRWWGR